jgi:hypothetical protein
MPAWPLPTQSCLFLDALDYGLHLLNTNSGSNLQEMKQLTTYLEDAGSVWTVAPDTRSLVRRMLPAEANQFERATDPADEAATELREAWTNVYGRHPNPSYAWTHAIKAIEALLWDLVIPKSSGATLGNILRALQDKPSKWRLRLRDNAGSDESKRDPDLGVLTLIAMLSVNADPKLTPFC